MLVPNGWLALSLALLAFACGRGGDETGAFTADDRGETRSFTPADDAAAGGEQSFREAMRLFCQVPRDAELFDHHDPAMRAVLKSEHIDGLLKNAEARALWTALASVDADQRGGLLREEASRAGVDDCPLADPWEDKAMLAELRVHGRLRSIADGVQFAFEASRKHDPAQAALPPPASLTPPDPAACCDGCAPEPAWWEHPGWQAIEFSITEREQFFSYSYEPAGDQFVVRAVGDPGCRGELVQYVITGGLATAPFIVNSVEQVSLEDKPLAD